MGLHLWDTQAQREEALKGEINTLKNKLVAGATNGERLNKVVSELNTELAAKEREKTELLEQVRELIEAKAELESAVNNAASLYLAHVERDSVLIIGKRSYFLGSVCYL